MAKLVGTDIPDNKIIVRSLPYIYGLGLPRAKQICKHFNIPEQTKTKDLTNDQLTSIQNYIEQYFVVEGKLKQQIGDEIRRLKSIKCYRGIRHILGMPARGQRTRHNAYTRRGHSTAVGGLKVKLTKT